MKKRDALLMIIITAFLLIIPVQAGAKDIVNVAETNTGIGPRLLPILIARDEGFFDKANLELKFRIIESGPIGFAAGVISGDIDFFMDNGGLLAAINRGVPMIYRNAIGLLPARLVARPGLKLEDVKGKVILTHFVLSHGQVQVIKALLATRGLGPVQVQYISDPILIVEMLRRPENKGKYDFGFFTNRLLDAEDAGLATVLDYFHLSDLRICNYIIERRGVNPDVAARFYKAFWRSVEFINSPQNKTKVINYLAKYVERDPILATQMYEKFLLKILQPKGIAISDREFREFASFFAVNIPANEIRRFYDPIK